MSDGGLPIVDRPEGLTPGWLTTVLDSQLGLDGATVVEAAVTPVGTGQMSDSSRVVLRFDRPVPPGVPDTVIAKQPAADPTSRETGRVLRSYESEVRFYQELAPALPVRAPLAYYADIDIVTGSFILLLEDLAPASPGDQLAGCSVEQAVVALDELVKLHAPRWGDPRLVELDWLVKDPVGSRQFLLDALPMFWSGFSDRYGERLGPEVRTAGESLMGGLDRYLVRSPRHRATVVHGDYRLDNLLFGPDRADTPVGVVDWQTIGHGGAMSDVAYFVGAGLLADERRATETALVRRYHDSLVAAGVGDYPWEDCWADYRRATFGGLVMAVAASMLVERTARGDEMFMTMAHRHARHALDLDAPALLQTSDG